MVLAWADAVGQARWGGSSYGRVGDRSPGSGRTGVWSDPERGRGGDRGAASSVGGAASAGTASGVHADGSDSAGCVGEAAAPRSVGGLSGHPGDTAALASGVDRAAVDVPQEGARAVRSGRTDRGAGAAAGAGESTVGVSTDRGGVPQPRAAGVRDLGTARPAPARSGAGTSAGRPALGPVPACPGP